MLRERFIHLAVIGLEGIALPVDLDEEASRCTG